MIQCMKGLFPVLFLAGAVFAETYYGLLVKGGQVIDGKNHLRGVSDGAYAESRVYSSRGLGGLRSGWRIQPALLRERPGRISRKCEHAVLSGSSLCLFRKLYFNANWIRR
jgi:hypothetical protein